MASSGHPVAQSLSVYLWLAPRDPRCLDESPRQSYFSQSQASIHGPSLPGCLYGQRERPLCPRRSHHTCPHPTPASHISSLFSHLPGRDGGLPTRAALTVSVWAEGHCGPPQGSGDVLYVQDVSVTSVLRLRPLEELGPRKEKRSRLAVLTIYYLQY